MSIAELKLDLIKKIISMNDIDLLLEIKNLLNNETDSNEVVSLISEPISTYEKADSLQKDKTEKVYVFNDWQQERINKSLEQYKNGEFITNEQAEIDLEKWFEEQEK